MRLLIFSSHSIRITEKKGIGTDPEDFVFILIMKLAFRRSSQRWSGVQCLLRRKKIPGQPFAIGARI